MVQYRFLETSAPQRYRLASNAIVPTAYGVGAPVPTVGGLPTTTLANPERGFFYYTECHYASETGSYSGGSPLSASDLANQAATNGYTIVYRYFYLEFYNSDSEPTISAQYKTLVTNDINTCRAAGVKL